MKQSIVTVFALCLVGCLNGQDSNSYLKSVREVFSIYQECSHSEGLSPCLKLKALSLIDRVSRMEKIDLIDGVVIKGKTEEQPNAPSLEEEEKSLPRSLTEKSSALTSMIFTRIARAIGSKSIEVSLPKLIESARGKGDDSKFGDIGDLFGGGDSGHGGGGHGGGGHGGGGGFGGGKMKNKKKKGGDDLKDFMMMFFAHKLAMLPLLVGGLFILAVKALTQAKIALLIAGIIFAKKLLANRNQGEHVEHVQASGWNGGSSHGVGGGWSGGAGGGGGWEGGWDKRSLEEAQNLAYKGQKS